MNIFVMVVLVDDKILIQELCTTDHESAIQSARTVTSDKYLIALTRFGLAETIADAASQNIEFWQRAAASQKK